jgi:hypothetical protein
MPKAMERTCRYTIQLVHKSIGIAGNHVHLARVLTHPGEQKQSFVEKCNSV